MRCNAAKRGAMRWDAVQRGGIQCDAVRCVTTRCNTVRCDVGQCGATCCDEVGWRGVELGRGGSQFLEREKKRAYLSHYLPFVCASPIYIYLSFCVSLPLCHRPIRLLLSRSRSLSLRPSPSLPPSFPLYVHLSLPLHSPKKVKLLPVRFYSAYL